MQRDIENARRDVELLEETTEKTQMRLTKALEALRKNRTPGNLRAVRLVEQAKARDERSLSVARTFLEHLINTRDALLTDGAIEATMERLEIAARAVPPRLDNAARKLERSEHILTDLVYRGEALADEDEDASLDDDIEEVLGRYNPQTSELLEDAPAVPAARQKKEKEKQEEEEEEEDEDPFTSLREKVVLNA